VGTLGLDTPTFACFQCLQQLRGGGDEPGIGFLCTSADDKWHGDRPYDRHRWHDTYKNKLRFIIGRFGGIENQGLGDSPDSGRGRPLFSMTAVGEGTARITGIRTARLSGGTEIQGREAG
jgi:hypothetical protein